MGENQAPFLSVDDQVRFNNYVIKAKECATNGEIEEAIKVNRKAYNLYPVEKIANRIKKLEEHLAKETNENQNGENNDMARVDKYVDKAKQLSDEGKISEAVSILKKAQEIIPTDKIARRIKRMQDYLAANGEDSEEDDDGDMVNLGDDFMIFKELSEKIYSHQKEGILWMWGLHKRNKGGILADDMGLGKTIQVVAFLSGLFDMEHIKTVLIVLPVAVIVNWQREFEKWAPGINVYEFHGSSKRERERSLSKVFRRGGVLLTSYGLVVNCHEQLAQPDGQRFAWDYMVLDEGHKIKNSSTKCAKGVHSIKARHRIILTGTPIQNNLKELWSLFDWCHQGQLLGSIKTFKLEFENPIKRAREKDGTVGEQRFGQAMAERLNKIIRPYLLRRTKGEVTKTRKSHTHDNTGHKVAKMPTFTRKNDLVCWVYLSEEQQRIYQEFATSEEVRALLNTSRSPLVALTVLKKICDHPRLLTNRQCHELKLDMDEEFLKNEEMMPEHLGAQSAVERINKLPADQLIAESGKISFLVNLLDNLKAEGHRTLVFSMARRILDILQKVLTDRGHQVARLDGTISKLDDREKVIERFSKNKNISVFLLTTQVGGVGLTITAADRVVIYDPSWNPATDAQAVDRCFRIGQDKNVVVYRLITCGSIEEKIYRRQVFKDSINKQTQGDSKNPYRYFTKMELRDLFMLDNTRVSTTQRQIEELHAHQRKTDTSLDAHIAFLLTLDMYGVSDHDLLFSKEAAPTEDHELVDGDSEHIENKAELAERMITQESESNEMLVQEIGYYPAPEVFKDAAPTRRELPAKWNFPGTSTVKDEGDNEDDDDDDVQVVLESSMNDLKLKEEYVELSDEDSFQEQATPAKPVPPEQPSSMQKIFKQLNPFMGRAAYGTPDSSVGSPATETNTTSKSLLGKVADFFTGKQDSPSHGGSKNKLPTPVKSMVDQLSMPAEHTVKGAQLFGDNDDTHNETGNSSGGEDILDVEDAVNDDTIGSPSGTKAQETNKSSVISIDDTPENTPLRQPNKFLQQGVLKAKMGSESSPISVDNTPLVSPLAVKETPDDPGLGSRDDELRTTPLRRPLGNISSMSNRQNNSPVPQSPAMNGGDEDEDEFGADLPPLTPRSTKKNKRRSVCALPTPRKFEDRPISPSASPSSQLDNLVREEMIVSPKGFDPILAMSPAKVAGPKKMSISHDMTLDGYEAFSSGTHLDSTVLPPKRGPGAALYDRDELGNLSSPAYQGRKKKARTSSASDQDDTIGSHSSGNSSVSRSSGAVASDTDDESTDVVRQGDLFNRSVESDAGDTPVARTTKRVTRVIESDEEMSDQEMVEDSVEEPGSSPIEPQTRRTTLQSHLKTFIEDSADENEQESEDEEEMQSAPTTPHSKSRISEKSPSDRSSRSSASKEEDYEDTVESTEDREETNDNDASEQAEEEAGEDEGEEDNEEVDEDEEDEEEEESESDEGPDPEEMEKYVDLMKQSREQYKSGNLNQALSLALDALDIYDEDERAKSYAQRLNRKIQEMQ